MWKINENKKELFKKYSQGYLYPFERGVFLCFKKSGIYEGVRLMFLGNVEFYEHKADSYLNMLYQRGLLDYIESEE